MPLACLGCEPITPVLSTGVLAFLALFSVAIGLLVIVVSRRAAGRGRTAAFLVAAACFAVLPVAAFVLALPLRVDDPVPGGGGELACPPSLASISIDPPAEGPLDPLDVSCKDAADRRVRIAAGLTGVAGLVAAAGALLAGIAALRPELLVDLDAEGPDEPAEGGIGAHREVSGGPAARRG